MFFELVVCILIVYVYILSILLMAYLSENLIDEIEGLKDAGKFDQALVKINTFLATDPTNEDALLQVTDIQYRQWEIHKAEKAIDFLNERKKNNDPLGLYIKWVLAMEKTERKLAKEYLQKALKLTEWRNHEILRCYGVSEFWYGNREKWIEFVEDAFDMNKYDAESIYNLVELYLLEWKTSKAKKMIKYFYSHRDDIQTIDKDISYYDMKILLFEKYIASDMIQSRTQSA